MANCYLKEAIRTQHINSGRGPNFEFAASSCQGWRNTQEDVHVIIPYFDDFTTTTSPGGPGGSSSSTTGGTSPGITTTGGGYSSLFCVFDGHNGVEVSTYAAKYLPEYIRRNRKYQQGQIVDGLREAFLLLDSSILLRESIAELREIRRQMHPEQPEFTPGFTSGTTAVVCLLKNNKFYCANIGDSRCLLCRNGRTIPLSNDTKPDDPKELKRIERAGGTVIKGRINMQINVSRAFGDHMYKCNPELQLHEQMIIALPEVSIETFNENLDEFLVLMCDGIWNSWPNDDLIQYIRQHINSVKLTKLVEDIVQKILPKEMPESGIKGKDNMTLIIVKFDKTINTTATSTTNTTATATTTTTQLLQQNQSQQLNKPKSFNKFKSIRRTTIIGQHHHVHQQQQQHQLHNRQLHNQNLPKQQHHQ